MDPTMKAGGAGGWGKSREEATHLPCRQQLLRSKRQENKLVRGDTAARVAISGRYVPWCKPAPNVLNERILDEPRERTRPSAASLGNQIVQSDALNRRLGHRAWGMGR
jgi:hypothetical protein